MTIIYLSNSERWIVGSSGIPQPGIDFSFSAAILSKAECPPLGFWSDRPNEKQIFCKASGIDQEPGLIITLIM